MIAYKYLGNLEVVNQLLKNLLNLLAFYLEH